jgi:hypothetical protein
MLPIVTLYPMVDPTAILQLLRLPGLYSITQSLPLPPRDFQVTLARAINEYHQND